MRMVHLLAPVAVTGADAEAAADAAAPDAPAPAGAALRAVRAEVLALVNAQRAVSGRRPLGRNGELTRAAQAHATDMARRGYLAHDTKGGPAWDRRVRRHGFGGDRIGENIARGAPDAAAAVRNWLASPGHRAQILSPAYTELGVGFAPDGLYWVLDFGGA